MHAGPSIPVGTQLEKAEGGPTSGRLGVFLACAPPASAVTQSTTKGHISVLRRISRWALVAATMTSQT
jgi:hypothetical protein